MLWDIEGDTEFKPIFKQYLLGAKGFIIVADVTRKNSLESIQKHIELCHSIVSGAPICVALNKSDAPHAISEETIKSLKSLSPSIVEVLKTSAKNGDAVLEIFYMLDKNVSQTIKNRS